MLVYYLHLLDDDTERDRFTDIYLKYRKHMHYAANRILNDFHEAEDATHKAFLIILKNLNSFSDIDSPRAQAYFVKITENIAIDILRKKKKHPTEELTSQISYAEVPEYAENQHLKNAIQKIPKQYQEVLMYFSDSRLDTIDIAKILGITRSNAQKRLWRAKEALRKAYEEEVKK